MCASFRYGVFRPQLRFRPLELFASGVTPLELVGERLGAWTYRARRLRSEQKLQGQLRRAWSADLIQRIEATILAAATQRGSQHLRRLAE